MVHACSDPAVVSNAFHQMSRLMHIHSDPGVVYTAAYICSCFYAWSEYTVKPSNKGHFGDGPVVPCREVFLFSENNYPLNVLL